MFQREEDGVTEPQEPDDSHRDQSVARGTLIQVEHEARVKHLKIVTEGIFLKYI